MLHRKGDCEWKLGCGLRTGSLNAQVRCVTVRAQGGANVRITMSLLRRNGNDCLYAGQYWY